MSKQSLLLVDGDARSLRVLEVSLRKVGFTVTTAINGPDALDKLALALPDLVIAETKLEEMDGFELCRRVRANPLWAEIPFVFLTAQTAIEHKVKGLELGVDDYLTKPIYIKEVVTRLQILLQKRQRNRIEEPRDGRTRFVGRLSDMAVVDLIQTIEISRKSGVITFTGEGGRQAAIYFRDGKVVDAEAGPMQGEDAVYRLLTWNDGGFEVVFRTVRRRDVITTPSQGLLMEGMRRLDEWTRLCEQLPPLDTRFEVDTRELTQRLGDIPDENNTILKLMDGRRSLTEVIDACSIGDLECLQAVSRLYFEGLLIEVGDGRAVDADRRVVSGRTKEDSSQWIVPASVYDETPVDSPERMMVGQRTPTGSQRVVTVPPPTGREGSGPKPGLPPPPRRGSGSMPITIARTDTGPLPREDAQGRGLRADTEPGRVALAASATDSGRLALLPDRDLTAPRTTPSALLAIASGTEPGTPPDVAGERAASKASDPLPARTRTVARIAVAPPRARTPSTLPIVSRTRTPGLLPAMSRPATPSSPAGPGAAPAGGTGDAGGVPAGGAPMGAGAPGSAGSGAGGAAAGGAESAREVAGPGAIKAATGAGGELATGAAVPARAPAAAEPPVRSPTPAYGTPAVDQARTPPTQLPRLRAATPGSTRAPSPTPSADAPARPTPRGITVPRMPAPVAEADGAVDAAPRQSSTGALQGHPRQFRPSGLRKIDEAVLAAQALDPELFAATDEVKIGPAAPKPVPVAASAPAASLARPLASAPRAVAIPAARPPEADSVPLPVHDGEEMPTPRGGLSPSFRTSAAAATVRGVAPAPSSTAKPAAAATAAAELAASAGVNTIKGEVSGRMLASYGADKAQVSGELSMPDVGDLSQNEVTHREIITIKPRRITRELPAVVPSPELLATAEAEAGDASTTIPTATVASADAEAADAAEEAVAAAVADAARDATAPSTAVERPRAASRPPRLGTGTSRRSGMVGPLGWLPWIFGAAGLALMVGGYVRCKTGARAPVVAVASVDGSPRVTPDAASVAVAVPDAGLQLAAVDARPARADARTVVARADARQAEAPTKPGYKEYRDAAAEALRDNNPEAALELADKSIALSRNTRAYVTKADALRRLDRVDEAVAAVDAALDQSATYAPAWEMRGKILWAARRTDEARAAYEKYLELKPEGAAADRIRELLER